jgi:hypothetical protein
MIKSDYTPQTVDVFDAAPTLHQAGASNLTPSIDFVLPSKSRRMASAMPDGIVYLPRLHEEGPLEALAS